MIENISKIFRELITLIEEGKQDKYKITLPYLKKSFQVSSNLYIIATMNSIDKSIVLRKKFTFLNMKPTSELVADLDTRKLMEDLNFAKEYKIKPLLQEYFYMDDKLKEALAMLSLKKGS